MNSNAPSHQRDLFETTNSQQPSIESNERLVQPLKWHGGKHYQAEKIIELMPPHIHYVEPYFGGGSVLLKKSPEGVSEVVNDIHSELTNFWQVLQNPVLFLSFQRIVEVTPFSQVEWETSDVSSTDPVRRAVNFFIRCRQSRAGKFDCFATLSRNRTRREMNEQASSWLTSVDGLSAVSARLKRVVVLCDDAIKVIKQQDGPKTLFYLDPPYLHQTRVSKADYDFEMSDDQHVELLRLIKQCKGKVMLSGYPNDLYQQHLEDWRVDDTQIDNKASSAKTKPKMTERIWMNY